MTRFPTSTGKASAATSFTIAFATFVELIAAIRSPNFAFRRAFRPVLGTSSQPPQGLRRHAHDFLSSPPHLFRAHAWPDLLEGHRLSTLRWRLEGRRHSGPPRDASWKKLRVFVHEGGQIEIGR